MLLKIVSVYEPDSDCSWLRSLTSTLRPSAERYLLPVAAKTLANAGAFSFLRSCSAGTSAAGTGEISPVARSIRNAPFSGSAGPASAATPGPGNVALVRGGSPCRTFSCNQELPTARVKAEGSSSSPLRTNRRSTSRRNSWASRFANPRIPLSCAQMRINWICRCAGLRTLARKVLRGFDSA